MLKEYSKCAKSKDKTEQLIDHLFLAFPWDWAVDVSKQFVVRYG